MHTIYMLISNQLLQARMCLLLPLEVQCKIPLLPINLHLQDSLKKFNFWTQEELEDVQGGIFLSWEILMPHTLILKWSQCPWICTPTPCIILLLTTTT